MNGIFSDGYFYFLAFNFYPNSKAPDNDLLLIFSCKIRNESGCRFPDFGYVRQGRWGKVSGRKEEGGKGRGKKEEGGGT